jgi:hypothetical protein
MPQKIQLRRDTAANWSSTNPTPAAGEACFELDTGVLKIGDGSTAYNSLVEIISGGGITLEQVQDDLGGSFIVAGTGITKTYNDAANTLTIGVTASTYQPLDSDLTTIAAAGNGSVLAATTASFTTADETKLDGIEALADVTDATNVAAAGAAMAVNTRVECIWTGSAWTTNDGASVPTSSSLIRTYNSQNDPAATTPPGPYNVRDVWNGTST